MLSIKNLCAIGISIIIAMTLDARPTLTSGAWVNISPSGFGSGNLTQGMTVDPANPDILYLCVCANGCGGGGVSKGIYKSTNGGSTWANMHQFDSPNHLRVDSKSSNHLYLSDGVCGSMHGFYVSNDGGATWTMPQGLVTMGADIGTTDIYAIGVDPADFNHVLISFHYYWNGNGASGVLESTNGGTTWTKHQPGGWSGTGHSVFFLSNPEKSIGNKDTWMLCVQDGGGFWRTTNAGSSWTKVYNGGMTHGGTQIYYAKTGALYAAAGTALVRSTDNGATWQALTSGVPYAWYFSIQGDGNQLYACPNSGPIIVSPESDGQTWHQLNTQQFGAGAFEMGFDPAGNIVYAACQSAGLWAYKVAGNSTGTVKDKCLTHAFNGLSAHRLMVSANADILQLSKNIVEKTRAVDIYDVKGKLIDRISVLPDGAVKIDRNRIGRQAVIISMQ